MFNKAKFNYYREIKNISLDEIARTLGIHLTTLIRKINGDSDFYRHEILTIRALLELNPEQVEEVFFDKKLAQTQEKD